MTLGTSEDVLKRKDLLAPPTLAPMPLWRLREVQRVKTSLKYAYNQLPTRWRADHWLSFNASAWTLWFLASPSQEEKKAVHTADSENCFKMEGRRPKLSEGIGKDPRAREVPKAHQEGCSADVEVTCEPRVLHAFGGSGTAPGSQEEGKEVARGTEGICLEPVFL